MWSFVFIAIVPALVSAWLHPHVGDRFEIQLSVGHSHPFVYSTPADLYETDLWVITRDQIHAIHAKGAKVVCYFSAGTYDVNRQDKGLFHTSDYRNKMDGYNEYYVNINSHNVRSIMSKRMDLAHQKGCDAVDPDNVNTYTHNSKSGFSFTKADQVVYNKFLADEAHSKHLAIALKNTGTLVPELHSKFDFVVDESCHEYSGQCFLYQPFLDAGKPVFNIEYVSSQHLHSSDQRKCTHDRPHGLQTQFKLKTLVSWSEHCSGH